MHFKVHNNNCKGTRIGQVQTGKTFPGKIEAHDIHTSRQRESGAVKYNGNGAGAVMAAAKAGRQLEGEIVYQAVVRRDKIAAS